MSTNKMDLQSIKHDVRLFTKTPEDIESIWRMWQAVFPDWPIALERLQKILFVLPGHHYLHDKGFCLSFLEGGAEGKIAAVGVVPEYRGNGLGTDLLARAVLGLKDAARGGAEGGGELRSVEVGSSTPRFWPQMPRAFSQQARDFFLHRGFEASGSGVRDLYKDITGPVASPDVLERVSKQKIKFSPWSPELYEECMAKQRAQFSWSQAYEFLAEYDQFDQVMVATDPDTGEQIGWTLMCDPSATLCDAFAFMPLVPSAEDKTGLIAAVGIDEKARGRGVGLALVVEAMESLKRRGVEGVLVDSVDIVGFYERLGMETMWEYEKFVWRGDL